MYFGEKIRLRAPEREDLPTFARWFNDPDVRRGTSISLPMSMVHEEKWFESMLNRQREEHPLCIEVIDGDDYHLIGNIGLFDINWIARKAEMGIVIGEKEYWNKGYGTEAVRLICQYGFEVLNLNKVYLRVFDFNLGGVKAYEKAGFVHEGLLREDGFIEGAYHDTHMMSILQEEWQAQKQ